MPRKKITLELKGLRTPRERMWAAVLDCSRAKGDTFTRSMIEDRAHPLHNSTIDDYLEGLALAGYVERVKPQVRAGTGFTSAQWRLVKRQPDAPRVDKQGRDTSGQGAGVEAMWRMAKVLQVFSAAKLAESASQGGLVVKLTSAKAYCRALVRSGHFAVRTVGRRGGAESGALPDTYFISNDTGPYPPAITREKCVFDRNNGTLKALRTPQEVCDATC